MSARRPGAARCAKRRAGPWQSRNDTRPRLQIKQLDPFASHFLRCEAAEVAMQRSTKKFVNLVLAAVGVALVGVSLAAIETRSASATSGPSQVLVVNSTNQPIPTAAM